MKLDVLRHRDFAWYITGNALSWLAMWMQRVAIGWLSWELTHSPLWVGLISMAQFAPTILFGPMFGVLADKLERRRHAITVSTIQMALAALLCLVSALGWMRIELLAVLCIGIGITSSAYQPVRLALVNDVVPRPMLAQAIALNSVVFNTTRFIGPALGGIAIATFGVASTFGINAFAYLALIWAVATVNLRPRTSPPSEASLLADLRAGLHNVREHAAIRSFILIGLITSFFARGVLELLPVFADSVFGRGAGGLAMLTSCTGLGAVMSGLSLSRFSDPVRIPKLARRSAIATGVLLVAFGLTPHWWLGLALVFAIGIGTSLTMVGLQVAIQSAVDDRFRGRVMSLWGVVAVGSPALGGAILGALSQAVPIGWVTVICGVLCASFMWFVRPARA